MGHSPRSNKGLPVYYGGNYPVSRVIRTRSLSASPDHSPTRGYALASPHMHGSSMHWLRLLVMLGIGLLCTSLLYVQYASAGFITSRGGTADATGVLSSSSTAAPQDALQQQALAGQQASPAAAPPGGFPAPELTHLVLVAGHAVYTGLDFAVANMESSWFLEEYQQIEGEAQSFLDHIRLGITEASKDPKALLLFSGGQTRKAAGPRSEGLSYWLVAEAAEWYGHEAVRSRAFTEEHARDSFENLLFSLCRFYEITGHYPLKITAVSYTLKQKRFEQLHRAAVRFPAESFRFIGTAVPPAAKGAQAGEAATVAAFLRDPYGCSGTLLAKKSRRDPFAVGAPHPTRCPAIAGLLQYCGAKAYTGQLPWDAAQRGGHSDRASGVNRAPGVLPAKGRQSSRSGIYT